MREQGRETHEAQIAGGGWDAKAGFGLAGPNFHGTRHGAGKVAPFGMGAAGWTLKGARDAAGESGISISMQACYSTSDSEAPVHSPQPSSVTRRWHCSPVSKEH